MGLLGRLFDRGKTNDELAEGITHSYAASAGQSTASENEMRKSLDIDIHTIEDEGIIRVLDNLCQGIPYTTNVYDKDGKIQAVTKIENGVETYIPLVQTHTRYFPWAPALRIAASKVFSARFIDKYDVETYKLKQRNEFAKIKRNMTSEERVAFGPLLNEVLLYCETALGDAEGGRKMLALKVQRKSLEVGLVRGQKRQG